ncbi:dipeptidyl-peptidase 8-like serine peptidase [Novymonas esmeraldas]|uniref:Dipeptidyl-peptidase 8-like serine peptidase n=1 Tax=Novymonas esmeraldas TaxID=1808958 RepID=A0AAW0F1A4_9TRYP
MPPTPMRTYMDEVAKYMDAFTSAAGKPQHLTVVGDRVYWTQGKQQELYSAPVGATEAVRVIAADGNGDSKDEKLCKEEELLRERTRSHTTGITSFHIRSSDSAVFYTSGVDMYVYYQTGLRAGMAPLKVFEYVTDEDKAHFASMGNKPNLFVKAIKSFDEADSGDHTVMTFVNNNNVYKATVTENTAKEEAPLSVAVEQITHIGDDLHQCGVADYIVQEEFSRYTGHYATDRYVVFSYTDSTHMRSVALLSSQGSPAVPETAPPARPSYERDVEEMPYPRVGDPNTRATLAVYDTVTKQVHLLPEAALRQAAPWTEYILRFGFKDAETLYVALLSRSQEDYAVLSCPIASLPTLAKEEDLRALYSAADGGAAAADIAGATPELTVEWQQHIDFGWVECPPDEPIHHGEALDVLCCHAAETETAHYHLYARPRGATGADAWRPLTSGAWNVLPGKQQVREDRVYFLANAEGRLSRILYSVPLSLSGAPHTAESLARLTPLDEHVYSYCVKDGHLYYVSSSATVPAKLYASHVSAPQERREITSPSWIAAAPETDPAATADPTRYFAGLPTVAPHTITVTSRRGVPLSAAVFISPHAPKDAPGPLALYIYGGPHVQLVFDNDYEGRCKAPVQGLLQHGISVAVVDNQMSNANGLRHLSVCKKNMGSFETHDYVDVTRYLCTAPASETGLPSTFRVDAARVAVFGWSYGGYATLLAMCQAADVFRMGFAGAPVGDWKLYDTGYTERYMGTLYEDDSSNGGDGAAPRRNEAYMRSTIGHYASGFPDECNRLYIAHGLLDENVHFSNSCHVVKALIEHAKPYNMLVYPGERHGLRQNRQSRLHHDAFVIKTMVEQL